MFNRLHTCKNPYQGQAKKVLCVCSAGLLRSPTAAVVLQREFGYNTRSCGCENYALIPLDPVLQQWADEIVVMNDWMVGYIDIEDRDKVICLDIPDTYSYMEKGLQRLIEERYEDRNGGLDPQP